MFKFRSRLILAALLLVWSLTAQATGLQSQGDRQWLLVAPDGEGFSISVPVKPEEQLDRVPMMGNTYKMHLLTSVDESTRLLYMVIMQEFPELSGVLTPAARLDKFMEGFKRGFIKSLGSTLGSAPDLQPDRDLNLKGHIGRQYTLSLGESRGLVRTFDGGRRVYVLLVLGADEKHSSVGRFFDSFEIKAAPAPVPQPVTETKPS